MDKQKAIDGVDKAWQTVGVFILTIIFMPIMRLLCLWTNYNIRRQYKKRQRS